MLLPCFLSYALVTLTFVWIFVTAMLFSFNKNDAAVNSIILGVLLIIIGGWWTAGNIARVSYISKEIQANILTTDTTIILINENNHPIATLTDVKTYKILQGLTNKEILTVTQHGHVNIYKKTNWLNDYSIPNIIPTVIHNHK